MTLDYFENIYVINLLRRIDRKLHITEQLQKIDCKSYKIIEAVDGKLEKTNSRIKPGAIGLLKTYFKIHKELNKGDYVVIIEDDCVFIDDFNQRLEIFFSNVPEDWNILYFGANHNYHTGSKTEKINDFCIKLNNSYAAHCVVFKRAFFERLISYLQRSIIEVDLAISHLQPEYPSYSSVPRMTNQLEGYSDIEEKWVNYDWLIK